MPPADTFEYDVFISYRHLEPDRSWVRRELVPRLDEAGLRVCIDVRSFRLGHPIVTEMGRAIEESRYTVAVLTPAFTQSGFTEFETVLAEHLGLEERRNRFLIIRRGEPEERLSMRARLQLDMTDDTEFDANVSRLIEALRQPPAAWH